jgi:5'-3' exonuclease
VTKIALIDGDTVAYRCAASIEQTKTKEKEPNDLAILRADELLYRILSEVGAEEYRVFISGSENFRKMLCPDYKANRAGKPIPTMLGACQEFLLNEWKAEVVHGYEADDAIGMAHNESTIICANDKDFKQIPGEHYNFVKLEFDVVDEETAAYNFWAQMLIGDSSDNVRGVDGLGPVKTKRILTGLPVEQMYETVRELYNDDERFLLNFRLLRILRDPMEFNNILKEIEDQNSLGESEGSQLAEVGGEEGIGEVSTSDCR